MHFHTSAYAQEYAGPLMPHVGGEITTAFSNRFGADAEGTVTFTSITSDQVGVTYSSTRGLVVNRNILIGDRQNSRTYVLGYAKGMPLVIPGATSLGISGSALLDLREKGQSAITLIHDADLTRIDGILRLVEKDVKLPLLIEDQVYAGYGVACHGHLWLG
jgi:hypothetical protein